MNNIFFTSDTHFGHTNIMRYSNRPFESVQEMDAEIIRRWNEVVGPTDHVYHLGDFSFRKEGRIYEILMQLNGKIHFIWGNHDQTIQRSESLQGMFEWCRNYYELRHNGDKFILFHYPIFEWNKMHRGSYHLFGHVHGSTPGRGGRSMDVGVDCHDFYPIHIDEVVDRLKDKEIFTHH